MDFFYIEKRRPKVKKGVVRATASERTEPSGKGGVGPSLELWNFISPTFGLLVF